MLPARSEAVSASGHSIVFLQQGQATLEIAGQFVPFLINFVADQKFNPLRDYQILLGCDVFKMLPRLAFDFKENKLYIGENWVKLGSRRLMSGLRISVLENSTIPPDCQIILKARVESATSLNKDLVIEAADPTILKANLGIIYSVSRPLEGTIQLMLVNPTNEPKVLYKGMHIAYANELERDEDGFLRENPD
jgi:hypothetical protein